MFFRKKIDLRMITPTSKMSLKTSCLSACGGDVAKAKELYDFMADGIGELPDFDTPPPSTMQQATKTIGNLFGWIKDNQGDLANAWNMIQSIRNGSPVTIPTTEPADIPPLPTK